MSNTQMGVADIYALVIIIFASFLFFLTSQRFIDNF